MSEGTGKFKAIYMITDAIFTLADRKGSTREEIWDYISGKKMYQESIRDKKLFFTQLNRISKGNEFFQKSDDKNQRYKLAAKFKTKLAKLVNDGQDLYLAQKQAMTTKASNPKKPVSKMEKAKMSKTTKGVQKLTKAKEKEMKATVIKKDKGKSAFHICSLIFSAAKYLDFYKP